MRIFTSISILTIVIFLHNQLYCQEIDPVGIKTIGKIIRVDPAMDDIIDAEEKIEVLGQGFEWSEGPVWVEKGNYLLFSDVPQNSIFKWKEGEGISLYLNPSGYTGEKERGGEPGSNGLAIDKNGKLILCQHGDRRIAKMNTTIDAPKADFITLADFYEGRKFNSPNDLTIKSNGELYFTDPPYGLVGNMEDPSKEIPFQGVYKLDNQGVVHLISDKLTRPNGIALSIDEKSMYVTNSDFNAPSITKYDLDDIGNFKRSDEFFNASHLLKQGLKGLPDGIKVRSDDYVFSTGPGGVLVLSPAGNHLGTIYTGEATSNCSFDSEEQYLYMTADSFLLRIKLKK